MPALCQRFALLLSLSLLATNGFASQCVITPPAYAPPSSIGMETTADETVSIIVSNIDAKTLKPAELTKEVTRLFLAVETGASKDTNSVGECSAVKALAASIAKKLDKIYGTALSKRYVILSSDAYGAKQNESFYKSLGIGATVMMCNRNKVKLIGLVVEMKQPIAYIQWENKSVDPRMAWIPVKNLLPPIGIPSNKSVSDDDVIREAMKRNRGSFDAAMRKISTEPQYRESIYRDLIADEECKFEI
jgi:hypothetical protein